MKKVKIFDAELKLMNMVWERSPVNAAELTARAHRELLWKKNTTYTVIGRLVERGALKREEPGFIITPLVSREETGLAEAGELVGKLFNGSKAMFLASFLRDGKLSRKEYEELRAMLDSYEEGKS